MQDDATQARSEDTSVPADQKAGFDVLAGRILTAFSIVAGIWAAGTAGHDVLRQWLDAREEKEQAQAAAVADVSRVLGVMRFYCDESFGRLVELGDREPKTVREETCYQAFLELSSLVYQAAIRIERPDDISNNQWQKSWQDFLKGIGEIAADKYVVEAVDCPWRDIAAPTNPTLHGALCLNGRGQ